MHLIIPKQIYGSKYGTTCHSISLLLCSTHALSHRPPFKKLTFFHKNIYIFLKHTILITVYTLGLWAFSSLLVFGLIHVITSWLVHVAQPKLMPKRTSFNQFRKTKKLALRVYCPNIYCGFKIAADNMVGRKKTTETYIFRDKIFFTKIV